MSISFELIPMEEMMEDIKFFVPTAEGLAPVSMSEMKESLFKQGLVIPKTEAAQLVTLFQNLFNQRPEGANPVMWGMAVSAYSIYHGGVTAERIIEAISTIAEEASKSIVLANQMPKAGLN